MSNQNAVKVLVLTHDVVGERMAGPAIRACELSRQLAERCDVTLASQMPLEGVLKLPFRAVSFEDDARQIEALAREADVLVLQGLMHFRFPILLKLGKRLVMDLYDPFIFENYPHMLAQPGGGEIDYLHFWDVQNEMMEHADFSICASERQRDMWLGRFCALARLTPGLFAQDASFRRFIDLVPFGLQEQPPRHERPVLRGVVPGIHPDDTVLLWGGGVWNWFDPLTLIRAVGELAPHRPNLKLYFLGVKHPNPEIPEMEMTRRAVQLAEELGLHDRHVFFNFGWVPYEDRQNYLCEADLGVTSHFDSIETRFSFRTRVLDYLWAGLPILTTEGDSMAELVAARGLGHVCRYERVEDWVEGISLMIDDPARRAEARRRVLEVAPSFHWSEVAKPLVRYCEQPYAAARSNWSVTRNYRVGQDLPNVARLALKSYRTLKTSGLSVLVEKTGKWLEHRIRPGVWR